MEREWLLKISSMELARVPGAESSALFEWLKEEPVEKKVGVTIS